MQSDKDTLLPAQEKTATPMEYNRRPRCKLTRCDALALVWPESG